MSNYQAIGGVSATLQTLLRDRMEIPPLSSGDTTVPITISTPSTDDNTEDPRINLFLFRVTENHYYKNQEIPGHGHPAAFGRPPLSLDLHFLLTAFGTSSEGDSGFTNETLAHYLLGSAMRVLHDYPIITEELVTGGGQPVLDLNLRGQFELVKLYLEPLSLEDLTKVWTALTVPYRLSAGYAVSVVQIESQGPRRYPRPVGELPDAGPRVKVISANSPRIDSVLVKRQETPTVESTTPYARIGDTLVLIGGNFVDGDTRVLIGTVSAPNPTIESNRIEVVIPDDAELQPGAVGVQVVRDVKLGEPPVDHTGLHSNLAVVMLVPRVTNASLAAGTVTVTGSRLFQENKPCQAIVGNRTIQSDDYATSTPASISFALPSLPAGTYAVRVRVNGAESIDSRTITIP